MNGNYSVTYLTSCTVRMAGTSDECQVNILERRLKEEVYIEQLIGYMKPRKEHEVLRLKKALYGLKQAPRINNYFKENDFRQCSFEHAIYVKAKKDELLIVTLYVDDLIFMENSQRLIDEFKKVMKLEFEMIDLGMMRYFLGLEIKHDKSGIFIYAQDIL
jgi:Reverse transcriptase (RNA-dependent DNA polymerase)